MDFKKIFFYISGPFYNNPIKMLICLQDCSSYNVALSNFSHDHSTTLNLFLHSISLIFQLIGNFGFLTFLDDIFHFNITFTTIMSWIVYISFFSNANVVLKCFTITLIFLIYNYRYSFVKNVYLLTYILGTVEVLVFQTFIINGVKPSKNDPIEYPNILVSIFLLIVRVGLQKILSEYFSGVLKEYKRTVNITLIAFMVNACTGNPFQNNPSPFIIGLIGWIFGILTDQKYLFFYTFGFLASLGQGISHYYSNENPTLPGLNDINDEYAHMTFFPLLLVHTIFIKAGHLFWSSIQ